MKILYVTPYFLPEVSGISYHVYHIAKRIKYVFGHDVEIYASRLHSFNSARTINGLDVTWFNATEKLGLRLTSPRMFLKLLMNSNADIIHVHSYQSLESVYVSLTKGLRSKRRQLIVLTPHFHPTGAGLLTRTIRKIYDITVGKAVLSSFSCIIAVTRHERKLLSKLCGGKKNIVVIPNGIDIKEIDAAPARLFRTYMGINKDIKIILYAGNLQKYKGVQFALYAVKKILTVNRNIRFVIVGNGPYKRSLIRLAKDLGIEKYVLFIDFLKRRLLLSALKDSDVFVMPSSYEAFSIITAEAMACGKPVIATKVGGLKELGLNNRYLINYKDIDTFAKLIILFIENEELAEAVGFRNRITALRFSWDKVAKKLHKLYLKLASDNS